MEVTNVFLKKKKPHSGKLQGFYEESNVFLTWRNLRNGFHG